MTQDEHEGTTPGDEPDENGRDVAGDGFDATSEQDSERERNERTGNGSSEGGGHAVDHSGTADGAGADSSPAPSNQGTREPHVTVTIEGAYGTVFERLEHPHARQHSELDVIVENVEETLLAVLKTGGGIRSEIYDAVEFELDEPWEIRIYLEVLAMHDLIRLQDDRWVPSDYFDRANRSDEVQ